MASVGIIVHFMFL